MKKIITGLLLLGSIASYASDCTVDLLVGGTIDQATKLKMFQELEKRGYTPKDYYELSDSERKSIVKKVRMGASTQQRQVKGGTGIGYIVSSISSEVVGRDKPIYTDNSHNLGEDVISISKDYVYTAMSEAEIYSDLSETILATIPSVCE